MAMARGLLLRLLLLLLLSLLLYSSQEEPTAVHERNTARLELVRHGVKQLWLIQMDAGRLQIHHKVALLLGQVRNGWKSEGLQVDSRAPLLLGQARNGQKSEGLQDNEVPLLLGQGRNGWESKGAVCRNEEDEEKNLCPVHCFRPDPVCGEDGTTYWCGCHDAQCNNMKVAHMGFCSLHNSGSSLFLLYSGQTLLLIHTVWLALLLFSVIVGLW